ncbi:SOS response-associated peptidase family protein [Achromobacter xylosoxidans]|uniref:SOS response-associated peptidase family protein n=1 Tax=Alcaligenes xylosoxydans xylosoxydans TaxID=85698 RepID=UPI001EEDF6C7|nr:SOS response-associated peptidase family protein [Achromobacter xylosoxidans]
MCGRIVQKSGLMDYVERIFPNPRVLFTDLAGPLYNIPPGTRPLTMHRLADDFEVDQQWWTWHPSGSKYAMNCARLDKILGNKWPWKMLTGYGQILVPADGWYEWKPLNHEPRPPKQPYFIHAADGAPLYFAALSNWRPHARDAHAGRRKALAPAPSRLGALLCTQAELDSTECPACERRPCSEFRHL